MAIMRPFAAVRPQPALAAQVAALPYDVMNSEEAREMAGDKPLSFLHVDRPEIDLDPSVDIYAPEVYAKAAENLQRMQDEGVYLQDETPCFYLYRLIRNGHAQMGLVGCTSIDDYQNNIIKKHEFTRADKEADRIRHVDVCDANTGPIFLTYRARAEITARMDAWAAKHDPVYDFTAEDGIVHTVWVIDCPETVAAFAEAFAQVPYLYIADGHHRTASAVKVGLKRREEHPDCTREEEFNYFLSVAFPDDQLEILPYHRVVADLNGYTKEEFLAKISEKFTVTAGADPLPLTDPHTMAMYLDGAWYGLAPIPGTYPADDPVRSLDVSIMQENLLSPVLGIGDPRTDPRIAFVGGIRGAKELVRLVDGGMAVAFYMYPTTVEELIRIADSGNIMPPKSTWFEPKLRSGIFVHKLS